MMGAAILKLSVQALTANKLRSGLTLLGVIIGVTSVITIISALEGMMGAIEDDLSRLGPTTFIVQKMGIITSHEAFLEAIKRKPIKKEFVKLIEDGCEDCEKVSPGAGTSTIVKYRGRTLKGVDCMGTTSNRIDIVDMEVAEGRFHSSEDDLYRRPVAFIGDALREEFFSGVDPLGKEIKIGGKRYTVIGVAKKQGSLFGEARDSFVIIPFQTFIKQFGSPDRRMSIVVKARSIEVLDRAQDEVRVILRSARHVAPDKPDDFSILTADTILSFLNNATKLFRFGLIGISSISVVVGGIVVMNIMMVSVTERTREIGIRKAVGAKQKHILLQFLFEALLTTLSGGIVGIVAGFLIARSLAGMINFDISPSALAVIVGLSISSGIGLIFGIYPAMKAARLNPIKALSYE